jgi:hypothetical protein
MKMKLILVVFIFFSGFYQVNCQVRTFCDDELIDQLEDFELKDGIFIKSFSVSLPRYSKENRHPTDSISIELAGKSKYWIVLVSSSKKMGLAKLMMHDMNDSLKLTLQNKYKLTLDASQMRTDKPATYYFKVSFESGNEGCAGFAIYYLPGYKIKKKR